MEEKKLKLFVVGESSGDPEKWNMPWSMLVLARNVEEALSFSDFHKSAAEVLMDKPTVLMSSVGTHCPD
jgi:hypothetical protein